MKTHKFDVEDAKKYGIEKAILLEHLKFHQLANSGNEDMVIDGKVHAFIKPKTIKEMYPYMNYTSIRRWLKELENDGVIESCKPKAKAGYHLKYYHVKKDAFLNDQNDQSNDQDKHSLNDQNDQSSIITNVKKPYDNNNVGTNINDKELFDDAKEVAIHLLDCICKYDPTHRYNRNPPSITRWITDIERALRLDGRTPYQLKFLISYIFKESTKTANFWRPNIESGKKLRQQFDKIKNQIKSEKSNGRTNQDFGKKLADTESFLDRYYSKSE